jgi:hypothetical protein
MINVSVSVNYFDHDLGSFSFEELPSAGDRLNLENATWRVVRRDFTPVTQDGWGGQIVLIVDSDPAGQIPE